MIEEFVLSSGRVCRLDHPGIPLLPHYHVLHIAPRPDRCGEAPPSEADIDELLVLARRLARRLGAERLGDPEAYSVLFNGGRTRRRPWLHVHLLPARSVAGKRWVLLCLLAKRWLRRIPGPRRAGRRAPRRPAWT